MACNDCYGYQAAAEAEAQAGDEARRKLKELREAAEAVIGHARPHYNRGRVVPGDVMEWLVKALERGDGGKDEAGTA